MTLPKDSLSASPAETNPNLESLRIAFDNSYARLPARFYSREDPTPVAAPRLIQANAELARKLGIDPKTLASAEGVSILAGNRVAEGAEPLAIAYAGHQFGNFVPQLGDGRANLLGEVVGLDGQRYDIQLKGSGPTRFSRRGDGRAALGPVLREYLVSEAMASLGVPTTRALAAVTTGERVFRETMLPGGIFTRVAASHLRVGTFQYFRAQGDTEGVRVLADYAIARHYPTAAECSQPYRAFLDGVIARHAALVAQWMLLGFLHGVMNTDNTSISGETLDYGPCAFLEAYDPNTVFSAIDQGGRYAYRNQPGIALWNLTRLAECLLPLLEAETGSKEGGLAAAQEALTAFAGHYEAARLQGLRHKLGLITEMEADLDLAEALLERMAVNRADFTLTFRRLCDAASGPNGDAAVRRLFADPKAYDTWAAEWRKRLELEPMDGATRAAAMRKVNPVFIPRNHLVEAVIQAAVQGLSQTNTSASDFQTCFQPFHRLLQVVTDPYNDKDGLDEFSRPATPEEYVHQTFCGT